MPLQSLIFLALNSLFWHEIGHIIMELQRANPQGKKICVARPSSLLWDIILPADIPDFPSPKKIALPKSSFDAIFTYFLLAQYAKVNSIFLFAKNKHYVKKSFWWRTVCQCERPF